jgi:hypothetical protein
VVLSCLRVPRFILPRVYAMRTSTGKSIAILLLLVSTPFVFGAERGSVPKAVLEQLDFMVGNWEEFPEGEGGPDRVLVHKREWSPEKHCLIVSWSGEFDGTRLDATGLVGYDHVRNQVTEHWYLTDGSYFETCYPAAKMTAEVWEGTTSWIEPSGRKVAGTCQLKKEGKDQFVWTANVKDGDKVLPPYKVVTRRIVESVPTSSPTLLKEYAALVVGEWECTAAVPWGSEPGAEKVPARATCSWAANAAALEWNLQIGEAKAQALMFWDPASKKLKEFVVASDGSYIELVVTPDAGRWIHEAVMTLPDGRRIDIRMVTTFAKDGDTHINEYPTHRDVFTRVKN